MEPCEVRKGETCCFGSGGCSEVEEDVMTLPQDREHGKHAGGSPSCVVPVYAPKESGEVPEAKAGL